MTAKSIPLENQALSRICTVNDSGTAQSGNSSELADAGSFKWFSVRPERVEQLSEIISQFEGAFFPGAVDLSAVQSNSVFVDFANFTSIREHVVSDMVIACETGITLSALNQLLAEKGQCFPVDVASNVRLIDLILAGDGGYLETGNGLLRSLVLGLESVHGGGQIIKSGGRVVKNVTGFDVTKLLIGSRGSLAFPYLAYLKLAALPEETASFRADCRLENIAELLAVSNRLLSTGLPLSALELIESQSRKEVSLLVQVQGPAKLVEDLSGQIKKELSGLRYEGVDNDEARQLMLYDLACDTEYSVEAAQSSLHLVRALAGISRGRLRLRPSSGRLFLNSTNADDVNSDFELLTRLVPESLLQVSSTHSALTHWENHTIASRCGLFHTNSKRLKTDASALVLKQVKEKFDRENRFNPLAKFG